MKKDILDFLGKLEDPETLDLPELLDKMVQMHLWVLHRNQGVTILSLILKVAKLQIVRKDHIPCGMDIHSCIFMAMTKPLDKIWVNQAVV